MNRLYHCQGYIYCKLQYYKVTSVLEAMDGECILDISSINFTYKTNCRNAYGILYIGLLTSKYGYIIYEFSEYKKDDTRRMI